MQAFIIIALLGIFASQTSAQERVVLGEDDIPVTLRCGNVTNREFNKTLAWVYRDPAGLESSRPPSANISITRTEDAGRYTCIYDGVQRAQYDAGNLTHPTFKNSRKSVTYNDGDRNRKLTCESVGTYPDPTFEWSRRKEGEDVATPLSLTDTNYEITTNGTKSVLNFHNVTFEDEQTFFCLAKNFAGNASVEILVRVKSRYAAVWPFIGIVIEVVILIIIIFAYEKRSKKAQETRPDFTPAEDEKPLNRDEGVEIRNRHGNK